MAARFGSEGMLFILDSLVLVVEEDWRGEGEGSYFLKKKILKSYLDQAN